MNAINVITAAPVAKPSKPSVRFTPLLVAVTIMTTQIITKVVPKVIEVSRTVDKFCEIGVSPSRSGKLIPK